jgi:hypothetical protein
MSPKSIIIHNQIHFFITLIKFYYFSNAFTNISISKIAPFFAAFSFEPMDDGPPKPQPLHFT